MSPWITELYLRVIRDGESLKDIYVCFQDDDSLMEDRRPTFEFVNVKKEDPPYGVGGGITVQEVIDRSRKWPYWFKHRLKFKQTRWPSGNWNTQAQTYARLREMVLKSGIIVTTAIQKRK